MAATPPPIAGRAWGVIPVYNNGATVASVARACRAELPHVLVVDDGSTDADVPALFRDTDIAVVRHARNRGKGEALRTALRYVRARGGEFMITLDADGQHDARDIRCLLPVLAEDPAGIVIGARRMQAPGVPAASRFGMRLSDFWLRLETGCAIRDSQSGFRAYPVALVSQLDVRGRRYDFEINVLARAAWAGLAIRSVDVGVAYAEKGKRVSHFRPFLDNLRITHRHVLLVVRRLLPWPHRRLVAQPSPRSDLLLHPVRFFRLLLREHATPGDLAIAAGVGVFLAALPLVSFHTVAILYVATRFRLNRLMAVAIQNLCAPPGVPLVCMEIGYFLRHGHWLREMSRETLWHQAPNRLLEWLLGSVIVAPVLAVITGYLVLGIAAALRRRLAAEAPAEPSRKIVARRRGNALGFLFFKASVRWVGLRGAYGLLYIVCAYYALFDRAAVRGASAYLRRRFPEHGAVRRRLDVYRLFISQGKHLIDRYYLLFGPGDLNVRLEGLESLAHILKARQGFVLLTAHLGNWQAILTCLRRFGRKVHLVMRPEDNAAVAEALRLSAGGEGIEVISPEGHLGGAVAIMEALRRGGIVSIMGDRSYGYSSVDVTFLGEPARFSCGGFHIAALAQCPVVVLTSAKVATRDYVVSVAQVFQPRYGAGPDKPRQLREWVQAFARLMEAYTDRYPFQCFLFEDVWREAAQ